MDQGFERLKLNVNVLNVLLEELEIKVIANSSRARLFTVPEGRGIVFTGEEMTNEIRTPQRLSKSVHFFHLDHPIIWSISERPHHLHRRRAAPRRRVSQPSSPLPRSHESLSRKTRQRRRRPPRLPFAIRVDALRGAGQEGHCQRETHGMRAELAV